MNILKHPDLGKTLEQSRSGLRDNHRRSLARLLFLVTGSAPVAFACVQIFNVYAWGAALELRASALVFFGAARLRPPPYLQRWVYPYLVALFSFLLVIVRLPGASVAASVWVLMMPVLAYLLLGKHDGMILSVPFRLLGGVVHYFFLEDVGSA